MLKMINGNKDQIKNDKFLILIVYSKQVVGIVMKGTQDVK